MTFQTQPESVTSGTAYCPLCTHNVDARILHRSRPLGQKPRPPLVEPGQRCPRCAGSLDAGYIVRLSLAA